MARAQRDDERAELCDIRVERGRRLVQDRTGGSWTRARAIATFCRMPREKVASLRHDVVDPRSFAARLLARRVARRRRGARKSRDSCAAHPLVERGWSVTNRSRPGPRSRLSGPNPVDQDVADARGEDPADDAARGRLAGTVRPQERDDLAGVHLERDIVERHGSFETARHVLNVDHSSSIRAL